MAYQQPMVTVDQNMTITPTSIERDQPAFIFGPNYELHRYSDEGEKAGTLVGTYDGSAMKVPYPGVIDPEAVDKGYTKLTGDNVVVQLANLTPGTAYTTLPETGVPKAMRDVNGGYTKLLFPGKRFARRDVDTGTSSDELDIVPKEILVGDQLLVAYSEVDGEEATQARFRTKVVAVEYHSLPFDLDEGEEGGDSAPECEPGTLVTIEEAIPETVKDNSVKAFLVDVFQGVEFTAKNLKAGGGYQWEQPATKMAGDDGSKFLGVKVNVLYALISDYFEHPEYCDVLFADLYVTYRELNVAYSDTIHSLVGASQVANMLGKISPDNPLAMGVYMACLNSTTDDGDEAAPVYFMAVSSDDAAGYDIVLNKASLTDKVYALAPTTRDETVLEKVRSHCLDMSAKTVKQWRIACASAEIPATVDRLNAAMDPQGDDFLAIPVSDQGVEVDPDYKYTMFRIVKAVDNINGNTDTAFRSTIVPGDKVRFRFHRNAWGEEVCSEYTVRRVINNYTVEVEDEIDVEGLTAASGNTNYVPIKVELYHTYTAAETADVVAAVSKAMASRRMLNVFPSVFKNDGVMMTGEFAACAIAGLISATEPQQPITNVTVRGIDDIPMVYQTFNRAQLNAMAAGGTFIIAQDMPNDLVYVRHQITTAYPDGNLNTAELSITKNVDSISYAFAEVFRPYYGKYNITPDLIATLENRTKDLVSQFARSTSVYGPQLIAEETVLHYVRQNELMKDHVDIAVTLGVPYPCNNIDIVLTV